MVDSQLYPFVERSRRLPLRDNLVACNSMRALLHAYLVGLEALDLFFV